LVIGPAAPVTDDRRMQIIGADQSTHPRFLSIVVGALAGTILVVSGLTFEFAAVVTPYVERLTSGGRLGSAGGPGGAAVWLLAVAAGAVFLGVGAARLATVLAELRHGTGTHDGTVSSTAADDLVMALNVEIGDGRPVPKLVVGRFGAAVIRDLPAPSIARHQGPYWEGRTDEGWIRIESPLDRATRDADRVRRFFVRDDVDYVVKVYAAVVAPDNAIPRTPTCAVITQAQLEPWLRSLPVQRSLNEARRAQLVRMLRGSI
jgi:hypothetical protein